MPAIAATTSVASKASFGSIKGLKPQRMAQARVAPKTVCMAGAGGMVPDMAKRNTMNLLLLGAVSLPAGSALGAFLYFFVPKRYCQKAFAGLFMDRFAGKTEADEWWDVHSEEGFTRN